MRRAALLLLLAVPAAARPRLKDLIKGYPDAKPDERLRIAPVLGRAHEKKATDALLTVFDPKRGSPVESAAIADALGRTGDTRAVARLAEGWDYLRSLSLQLGELPAGPQVLRLRILEALGRLGGDQSVTILEEAINDKDPRVIEEAVRGLGRLQVRDAVGALQQLAVGSDTGNLRQAVLEALGDIGDKRAMSTLEQAMTSPDKYIEVEAAYGLAKLGKKDAVATLEKLLKSDPGEEKAGLLAAYYLVKLDKNAGLSHLDEAMRKTDSPLAPLAAQALGKTENPRAVLVLIESAKSSNATVRQAVAEGLARLGGPRAISGLKKMRGDPNPNVRSAAINGLADLGELD